MRQMKVLIASRCRSAADTAKAMLDGYGCRADVRLISNGSLDPLRDLPQLPDLLLLYDHNASGELETLMAKPAAARPEFATATGADVGCHGNVPCSIIELATYPTAPSTRAAAMPLVARQTAG